MRSIKRRESTMLILGDVVCLYAALWVTLLVRYFEIPSSHLLALHLPPFTLLFAIWLLIFFVAGFYEPHTKIFRAKMPERILRVQVMNIVLAATLFFFLPLGITPKTNLIIYLGVSFLLIVLWRLFAFPRFMPGNKAEALLICGGKEFQELSEEVNGNQRYPFAFTESISIDHIDGGALSDRIFSALKNPKLAFIVVDSSHRKLERILPHLYKPFFSTAQFIDARDLYEEIFERLPLSILGDQRTLESFAISREKKLYTVAKRVIDMIGAIILGIPTLLILPILALLLRFEGSGRVFISQRRVGRGGETFLAHKIRTMERMEYGVWIGETDNKVTKIGAFLRRTRLDELPQLWNILKGDLSFVGPRPDLEGLSERLAAEIPFYKVRSSVVPGLSGWAQLKQDYAGKNVSPQSVEESKKRFMYDLYYLKRRSLILDLVVIVRTARVIISRSGS